MFPADFTSLANKLRWLLRFALALQVTGAAGKFLFAKLESETPLFGLLAFDWLWPEQHAQRIDDGAVWLNFGCGIAVLLLAVAAAGWTKFGGKPSLLDRTMFYWQTPLLLVALLFEVAIAAASYLRMDGFFPAELFSTGTPLEPVESLLLTDLFSHAVRFAIPVTLILLTPLPGRREVASSTFNAAMWLARVAAALTFFAHGLKAIYLNPIFVDYILAGSTKLVGHSMAQSTAEFLLQVIGYLDLLLAVLLVAGRFRSVAIYMAAWGLITACSRVVYGGFSMYFEVLIRAGNYLLPLAVAIYFVWYHKHRNELLSTQGEQEDADVSGDK